MKRTIELTKITYAKVEISEGDIQTKINCVEIMENDPKKAIKKARKELGDITPIKTEKVKYVCELADDIFLSMAHRVRVED